MKNIAQSVILEMAVGVPPIAEQRAILTAIDSKCGNVTRLVSQAERATTLLQERRTALISAAVTGKIDVRGWNGDGESDA